MVCLKRGKENIYAKNIAKEPVKIINAHKPIVNKSEFEKANLIIDKQEKKYNLKTENILKKLVYYGKYKKIMCRITSNNMFKCYDTEENNCYCEGINRKRKICISETKLIGKILDEIEKNNKGDFKEFNNDLSYSINKNKKDKYNNQQIILNKKKVKLYEQYIKVVPMSRTL